MAALTARQEQVLRFLAVAEEPAGDCLLGLRDHEKRSGATSWRR